ncbi:hypothetical protein J6590_006925 [Homalodisca vitripennis]|nr:hypothetical protein J6590_006925 [Homalodisca vitripennis]
MNAPDAQAHQQLAHKCIISNMNYFKAFNIWGVLLFSLGGLAVCIVLVATYDVLKHVLSFSPPLSKTHSAVILSVYPVSFTRCTLAISDVTPVIEVRNNPSNETYNIFLKLPLHSSWWCKFSFRDPASSKAAALRLDKECLEAKGVWMYCRDEISQQLRTIGIPIRGSPSRSGCQVSPILEDFMRFLYKHGTRTLHVQSGVSDYTFILPKFLSMMLILVGEYRHLSLTNKKLNARPSLIGPSSPQQLFLASLFNAHINVYSALWLIIVRSQHALSWTFTLHPAGQAVAMPIFNIWQIACSGLCDIVVALATYCATVVPRAQLLAEAITQGMFMVAMYQLFCLMVAYCGGEAELIRKVKPMSLSPRVGPCCCWPCCCCLPLLHIDKDRVRWLRVLVLQLPVVQGLVYMVLLVMWAEEQSLYQVNYMYLQPLVIISILCGVWGIIMTMKMLTEVLQGYHVQGKFIVLQLVLILAKLQGVWARLFVWFGWLPCKPPITPTVYANLAYNSLMLWEMVLLCLCARHLYKRSLPEQQPPTQHSSLPQQIHTINQKILPTLNNNSSIKY